ncbi:MAG: hypothetical protein Q7U02_02670, partial [Desulfosalsimonadaceae bacterium]|nr:hypothetical protein [Desulfosalsimonadaceae bacterium]
MGMCAGSNRTDRVRVGFIINFDFDSWLGGFNYLKTLIDSVMALPERTIEPVIFTGKQNYQRISEAFPNNEIVISGMTDRWSLPWTLRMIFMLIFRHDFFLDRLFKKHGIRILSHAGLTDSYSGFPSLCWIPDFQHRRLPDFFSPWQKMVRDRRFTKLCRLSGGVILSSRDAQETLKEFYPKAVGKSFVLNFVTRPDDGYDAAPLDALL